MKYLIAGTGGVGGSIAAFLALAGQDVTCIARGTHLQAIREHGLKFKSDLKGEQVIPMKAFTAEEYTDKADVIFVCVKGYSIDEEIANLIKKAAHEGTVVLPILNVYGTGPRIQKLVPGITVIDGCIYIVGFISAPGEITQMGSIFKLVFGARPEQNVSREKLEAIQQVLADSGIKAPISEDINRDTFVKWSFISAMACTGAYYDVPMGALQTEGEKRETFKGLSRESTKIGEALGVVFEEDPVMYNLKVLDKLDPESTASMQKDLQKRHESEINGLLFNMIELAEEKGIEIPTYRMVAGKFK